MKVREPPIPEGDSDMSVLTDRSSSLTTAVGNPRDTFMSSPADSTKSPSMCLSPGVSSNHASSPVTTHSFVAWNQGYHQGFDTMAKQIPQEGRTPIVRQGAESVARPVIMATKPVPVSRETEADHSLGDEEGLVPVIVSLGDNPPSHRDKKCVSTEVPLKDIINGAPCAMEGIQNCTFLTPLLYTSQYQCSALLVRRTAQAWSSLFFVLVQETLPSKSLPLAVWETQGGGYLHWKSPPFKGSDNTQLILRRDGSLLSCSDLTRLICCPQVWKTYRILAAVGLETGATLSLVCGTVAIPRF